jgi:hypothetical protein
LNRAAGLSIEDDRSISDRADEKIHLGMATIESELLRLCGGATFAAEAHLNLLTANSSRCCHGKHVG